MQKFKNKLLYLKINLRSSIINFFFLFFLLRFLGRSYIWKNCTCVNVILSCKSIGNYSVNITSPLIQNVYKNIARPFFIGTIIYYTLLIIIIKTFSLLIYFIFYSMESIEKDRRTVTSQYRWVKRVITLRVFKYRK